jgi:hypothetical protein
MPLVVAKCTECGGTVKVDSDKKAAVCDSCGNAFIVEDAINNYTNQFFNNTNISDSTVTIINEAVNNEFEITGGELISYRGEATDVVIPANIIKIGDGAFEGLEFMTTVEIPKGVKEIGKRAFFGCAGLTTLEIPESVEKISSEAFSGCTGLTTLEIPESVKEIESLAFSNCVKLSSLTIPKTVSTYYDNFKGCYNLSEVKGIEGAEKGSVALVLDDLSTTYLKKFNHNGTLTIPGIYYGVWNKSGESFPGGRYLGIEIRKIVISEGIKFITDNVFRGGGNETVQELILPSTLINIGNHAFSGLRELESICIPENVQRIGDYAFSGLSKLKSVCIPENVQRIGERAFYKCTSLSDVTIMSSKTEIKKGAFSDTAFEWIKEGRCRYCGRQLSIFGKCKGCGRPN